MNISYQGPVDPMVWLPISHMGDQGSNLGGSKNFNIVLGLLGLWMSGLLRGSIEEIHLPWIPEIRPGLEAWPEELPPRAQTLKGIMIPS